jgi:hypothetical protein
VKVVIDALFEDGGAHGLLLLAGPLNSLMDPRRTVLFKSGFSLKTDPFAFYFLALETADSRLITLAGVIGSLTLRLSLCLLLLAE